MLLKQFIHEEIKRILKEETINSFNLNEFANLHKLNEKLNYASRRLLKLGTGSSRVTYKLSDGNVLKIAINEKGLAQNEQEVNVITNPVMKDLVANIFDFDGNKYEWLISEYVNEFASEKEFESFTGFSIYFIDECSRHGIEFFDCYFQEMEEIENDIELIKQKLNKPLLHDWEIKTLQNNLINYSENLEERKAFAASDLFKRLEQLVKADGMTGDVGNYSHWGYTNNNRIVLLDYGLNDEIWNKFY